mmetsp:Transcript_22098/g.51589  ORF Transcript_22098/g.51589 Transcript_22098/m.51589 type:complete len:345 (-) Transcript_22098:258-1292(-)
MWVDPPGILVARIRPRVHEAGRDDRWAAHLPSLAQPSDFAAHLEEERVVLLGRAPQLKVLALVVGALNLEGSQRPVLPLAAGLRERDPLSDENEVGRLVADVAVVILRCLRRERCFEQAVCVDLGEIHALLVDRAAQPVRLCWAAEWERYFGKELRVQAGPLLLVHHLKQELRSIVASCHLDRFVDDDLGHCVVCVQGTSSMECLRQPLGAKLLQTLLSPWELQAVDHARRAHHVEPAHILHTHRVEEHGRLRHLSLAPLVSLHPLFLLFPFPPVLFLASCLFLLGSNGRFLHLWRWRLPEAVTPHVDHVVVLLGGHSNHRFLLRRGQHAPLLWGHDPVVWHLR